MSSHAKFGTASQSPGSANVIHLRSLTTNAIHPEVARSILKTTDTNSAPVRLHIIGTYIVALFRDIIHWSTVADCMQIWDWKSKNGYQVSGCYDSYRRMLTIIAVQSFVW